MQNYSEGNFFDGKNVDFSIVADMFVGSSADFVGGVAVDGYNLVDIVVGYSFSQDCKRVDTVK